MTMRMGMMMLEDGLVCIPKEFWQWKTDPVWDKGCLKNNEKDMYQNNIKTPMTESLYIMLNLLLLKGV